MAKTTSGSRKPKASPEPEAEPAPASASEDIVDAEVLPEPEQQAASSQADVSSEKPESDVEPEVAGPALSAQTPRETGRGAGFAALVLGGAVAAGLGFGAAWQILPRPDPEMAATVAQQQGRIAALEGEIDNLSRTLAGMNTDEALLGISASIDTKTTILRAELEADIQTLAARITDFEKLPTADGALSDAGVAAYSEEIAALRAEVATQSAEVARLMAQAAENLDEVRAEAAAIESNTAHSARQAAARAALAQVRAAVENGTPFAAALPDLAATTDGDLPGALVQFADEGVASLAALQSAFPEAAREALAQARANDVDGESSGLMGFLREQFDVRSVAPKDGASTDAILSRAEAAVRDGRLRDALAEIENLPDVARNALSEWAGAAQARIETLAAIEGLSMKQN